MNCKTFENFELLRVEVQHLKDVIKCILHTVVFQRALGSVEPEETNIELLDIYYVQCRNSEIVKLIEDNTTLILSQKGNATEFKFNISFYQFQVAQRLWGNRIEESTSSWEEWIFSIEVLQSRSNQERRDKLSADLQNILETIITESVSNLNHIPSPWLKSTPDDPRTYPFKITVPSRPVSRGFLGNFLPLG